MEDKFNSNKLYLGLMIIIIIGIIIPYACQFVIPLFNESKNISGIEIWNQFVSMILGIVATTLSVVSLKMCFDSASEAKNTELRTQQMLDAISEKISILTEKQEQMSKNINEQRNLKDEFTDVTTPKNWSQIYSENKI